MAGNRKKKKGLVIGGAVVLTAALGAGIWFGTQSTSEPVNVYPFQYVGMTEFWGDTQESYGPVTTDKIQTEYLSDTQTVTEVAVQDGQEVKKGDVLFSFDTTLDALSLERKRLDVEKIRVQIKAAEERLQETREMVPYVPPAPIEPEEEDLGEELKDKLYQISENTVYDGAKKETALICWLKDGTSISDAILQELYETSLQYRAENAEKQEEAQKEEAQQTVSNASNTPEGLTDGDGDLEPPKEEVKNEYKVLGEYTCNGEEVKPDDLTVRNQDYLIRNTYRHDGKTYWLKSAVRKSDGKELEDLTIPAYPEAGEARDQWEKAWKDGVKVQYMREVSVTGQRMEENKFIGIEEDALVQLEMDAESVLMFQANIVDLPSEAKLEFEVTPADGILAAAYDEGFLILSGKPEELTAAPIDYTVTAKYTFDDNHQVNCAVNEEFKFSVSVVPQPQVKQGEFYVVFKTTQKNFLKGAPIIWQGAKVTVYEEGGFDMQLYDAAGFMDHTLPPEEEVEIELPEIDPNAIYTAEEILEMQKQCYATIKEQNEKLVLAEAEYAIMERELGDGNVYAEIDGKVVSILPEEEAKEQRQPVIKVSGGGGFYVEGSVSELEKEKLKIGQEVTINDWRNGGTYTGEVVSIGDFPSDNDNWNGMGNPTASYYPFKAFVDGEADLEAGSYVSMSYSTASAQQGIYLEKAFVRTEKGDSYIFVRGSDGKLSKRDVRIGKVLWGSYYEILSDLSEEDYLAFPYGKEVKQGAPTVESDISALYSY